MSIITTSLTLKDDRFMKTARLLKDAYWHARQAARGIGVPFEFTFEEWVAWWEANGGLHRRGSGQDDLMMIRRGAKGSYSLDNVYAGTRAQAEQEKPKYDRGGFLGSGRANPRSKRVSVHGRRYDCLRDAARAEKVPLSTAGGYARNFMFGWRYVDEV